MEKKIIKQMSLYSEISMLAYSLFDNDLEKARNFIESPNEYLFGKTALEVCLLDQGENFRDHLKERLGIR